MAYHSRQREPAPACAPLPFFRTGILLDNEDIEEEYSPLILVVLVVVDESDILSVSFRTPHKRVYPAMLQAETTRHQLNHFAILRRGRSISPNRTELPAFVAEERSEEHTSEL